MCGSNPVASRALPVLLGFETEIRAFIPSSDQYSLSRATWWLSHSVGRTHTAGHASWSTDTQLVVLARHLYARVTKGHEHGDKRRTKAQLSVGQVRALLRNLVPVALGLRPSCLVDSCALTKELAELLLKHLLANKDDPSQRWFDPNQVRFVLLDDNVFFVNVRAFVREKMVELATGRNEPMYVNVSASLSLPRLLSSSSEAEVARLKAFADWTASACKTLLLSTCSRVLEWKRPSTLNATALAGMLLCYPCVYDRLEDKGVAKDSEWREQDNCLALCPLWLFQIKALVPNEPMETVLQEFSVPQHLLDTGSFIHRENKAKIHCALPLWNLLRAHCQLKLQRAIERNFVKPNDVRPQVHVSSRMLHRVAL